MRGLGSHPLHFDLANMTLCISDKTNRSCQEFVVYAFFFRVNEVILTCPYFGCAAAVIIQYRTIRDAVLNLQTPRCANAVDGSVTAPDYGNGRANFGQAPQPLGQIIR